MSKMPFAGWNATQSRFPGSWIPQWSAVVRSVFDQLCRKLDGQQASAKAIARKRAVLFNALEYAVELKLFDKNPVLGLKWTAPKTVRAIDKRVVINPKQATRLLDAVGEQESSGPEAGRVLRERVLLRAAAEDQNRKRIEDAIGLTDGR
jgi:site-specific recombinase XerC